MGQEYWDRVRASIASFWSQGQELRCIRIYPEVDGICQMCNHKPIKWHHVLCNQQTNGKLIVGSECINNYKVVTGAQVVFPARFQRAAEYLNGRHHNCVVVIPGSVSSDAEFDDDWDADAGFDDDWDFDDEEERERLMDLGLDPEDPDPSELAPHGMSGDEDLDDYE